ncbi:class I SAM-dependent methyltransferase [Thiofilum flexile]|uniref:class I SAM-dependent methyltransferase n=1 Tax=Thiofilum flexile TaxID=125627 RepID=UPI00036B9040|nr:methyltransferase domain-containing protein [Thiofilum flexile]
MNKQKPLHDFQPINAATTVLQGWYESHRGQATLQQLNIPIRRMTADIFGYYALEMGLLAPHQTFLTESRISHHIRLGSAGVASPFIDLSSHWTALPFEFGTIDLVLSTHSLELVADPTLVLNEIERVLMPEGHCILIGFNPYSALGMQQWLSNSPSKLNFPSPWQVSQWLQALGFEVLETKLLSYRPNWGGMRFWHYTRWWERACQKARLPFSHLYIIHARKKVTPLIPLGAKRKWWRSSVLRPVGSIAVKQTTSNKSLL